jgi:hypothetical protein
VGSAADCLPLLDRHEALIRGVVAAPQAAAAAHKLRATRARQVRASVLEAVGPDGEPDLTSPLRRRADAERARRLGGVQGRLRPDRPQAGKAASAAIKTLIDAARNRASSNSEGEPS